MAPCFLLVPLAVILAITVLLRASSVNAAIPAVAQSTNTKYIAISVHDECQASLQEVRRGADAQPSKFHTFGRLPTSMNEVPEPVNEEIGMLAGRASAHHRWAAVYRRNKLGVTVGNRAGVDNDPMLAVSTTFVHAFVDPRLRVGESIYDHHAESYATKGKPSRRAPHGGHHHHDSDGDEGEDGRHSHIVHLLEHSDIHVMFVPHDVDSLEVYCHNFSMKPFVMSLAQERHFSPMAADPSVTATQLYAAGPVTTQINVVFISAGFTSTQKALYDQTIDRALQMMNPLNDTTFDDPDIQNMHATVPFDRYWPFWNVYSVFQASPESGATRDALGIKVNNNLKCYHPQSIERAVTCPFDMSLALAAASNARVKEAPDRVIIVVIVNTPLYGGSAIYKNGAYHIGHFYQGRDPPPPLTTTSSSPVPQSSWPYDRSKFASLVKHEISHAYGNLFDEYDVGISETKDMKLKNCAYPTSGAPTSSNVQWSYWFSELTNNYAKYAAGIQDDAIGKATRWGLTSPPGRICGYSNYYKPNANCMMQSVRDYFMCPVCREQATVSILNNNFSLFWPRSPLEDAILVIPRSDIVTSTGTVITSKSYTLHLPDTLRQVPYNFLVVWKDASGRIFTPTETACPQCIKLDAQYLSTQPVDVVLTIFVTARDDTNFLSPRYKTGGSMALPQLVQTTTFRFKIVTTTTGLQNLSSISASKSAYGRSSNDADPFYIQCLSTNSTPNPLCQLNFTSRAYESPENLAAQIAAYDQWVFYMVGGLALLFVLLWFFAANYYQNKSHGVVRAIFKVEFQGLVNIVRRIMQFAAVMFMLASVSALGLSTWLYFQLSALGKIVIALGVALAVCLYIMAFIGFWAVAYRSKKLVVVNGVVLYIGLTFLVVSNALIISIGADINVRRSYWNKQLSTFWKTLVSYNPERACAIEGMLECSGYYLACNTIVGSTDYCPSNCENTNAMYGTSCQLKLITFISDNYLYINVVLGTAVGMMLFALIFNFFLYFKLLQMKRDIQSMHKQRIVQHARKNQMSVRAAERNAAMVILKSLDHGDLKALIKEFNRIDTDNSGQLSRSELAIFFKKALLYNITPQELSDIFAVADLDGDGQISLPEFLMLFNQDAEKVLAEMSGMKGLRATVDQSRADEIKRRASKHFGDHSMSPHNPQELVPPHRAGNSADSIKQGPLPTNGSPKKYRPPSDKPPDPEGLI